MGKNDEWCQFCEDRMKAASVLVNGRRYEVCKYCKALTLEDPKSRESGE